jgi:hypothetical protein
MLCVNQHSNPDDARFCQACGTNQFIASPRTIVYQPAPGYNGVAIASVVCLVFFIPIITPVAQIILGNVARNQIRTSGEQGDGLALAGIIIGSIGLALSIVLIIVWIALFAFAASHINNSS